MTIANNPILSGFYPDPSICAVGDDFYLVNSTFSYFPGIPIMHSRDLAHWEQIGNVMDRASQLPLHGCGHSEGLFAPAIRYHDSIFYVICTNISGGGNFIVTARDPAGPWSEPYYLPEAAGIDPSLFFDEDGTCYYIGTHPNPKGCRYDGDWFIWIQELDLETMHLVGKPKDVWNGAMRHVIWPEGPHLYKKDGYYYILHAEGGTGPHHAVTVCRSRSIWGPYENNACNPIVTHRHMGKDYPVQYVGHGDLVKTLADEWYMVLLAVRPLEGYTTMGRETFLARVVWEDGWPVVNPGFGRLTDTVEIGLAGWEPGMQETETYHFDEMERLGDAFLFLRNPEPDSYCLRAGEGLKLSYGGCALTRKASPTYTGIRQKHHAFRAETHICLPDDCGQGEAGIALVQSNEYHLRAAITRNEASQAILVSVYLCEQGRDRVIAEKRLPISRLQTEAGGVACRLSLEVRGLAAAVKVLGGFGEIKVTEDVDIRNLSTEIAGGFVGCTVGLYAAGGDNNDTGVVFKSFTYKEIKEKSDVE